MRLRFALLSATALAVLPVIAHAQPVTGLYVAGGAGPNYQMKERVRASTGLLTGPLKLGFDDVGGTGVASVGYGLGNGVRVEIEGNFRYNSVKSLKGTGYAGSSSGDQQKYGGMVNALYDFDVGMPFLYPYVGVGAGYEWNKWHNVGHTDGGDNSINIDDTTKGDFAYQGIVGVAYPIAPIPGLSATVEYRFLGTLDHNQSLQGDATYASGTPGAPHYTQGNADFGHDYNHSLMIGIRYAFGVAPPPPPPAPVQAAVPQPAPARTYLVFFDWDKSDLTARARQIISDAATASTHVQTTRIEVNGYTDLSGTAKYNMGLSIRRAKSVEAELVKDGVAESEIAIQGFGEEHPLVPTAQGVREPQNRRVEIILK